MNGGEGRKSPSQLFLFTVITLHTHTRTLMLTHILFPCSSAKSKSTSMDTLIQTDALRGHQPSLSAQPGSDNQNIAERFTGEVHAL